jgi:DNA-3-methyladenine glycosylase I
MPTAKTPLKRCVWAQSDAMIAYHDQEWGVPQHDDRTLFEFLILEGAQAGLSWETILKRRAGYREAFDGFDPRRVARYDERKTAALLQDPRIIRNRLKVAAAVTNAQAFLQVQKEFGTFGQYLWRWVKDDASGKAAPPNEERVTRTDVSDALSKDLQARGFRFVGTTICYAFMQAVGMVNDHDAACFRRRQIARLAPK